MPIPTPGDSGEETTRRRIADAIVYGRWMAHPHGDDFPAALGDGIRYRPRRQRRRNLISQA